MTEISVEVHRTPGDWSDLLSKEADSGHKLLQDLTNQGLVQFAVFDGATESGRAAIAIRQEFETGEIAIATMTLRTFLQATKLIMDSYIDEVRETFGFNE